MNGLFVTCQRNAWKFPNSQIDLERARCNVVLDLDTIQRESLERPVKRSGCRIDYRARGPVPIDDGMRTEPNPESFPWVSSICPNLYSSATVETRGRLPFNDIVPLELDSAMRSGSDAWNLSDQES